MVQIQIWFALKWEGVDDIGLDEPLFPVQSELFYDLLMIVCGIT